MSDTDSIAAGLDSSDASVLRKLDAMGLNATADPAAAIAAFRKTGPQHPDTDHWQALNDAAGSTFAEVFQSELDALDGQAGSLGSSVTPARLHDVNRRARKRKMAGLALSGGGTRSATFNLGVLQALAEKRLLREFDLMSTVSGGGYIGGWLSKLIAACDGKVERVEEALSAPPNSGGKVEHDAIQYLRKYSNYMTPKLGFLSADTWTLLITYVRNTMLNMVMVGSWLACLLLLPRLLVWCAGASLTFWPTHVRALSIVCFLVAVFCIAHSISRKGGAIGSAQGIQSQGGILVIVCLPLSVAALAGSLTILEYRDALSAFWLALGTSPFSLPTLLLLAPGALYFAVWCAGWITAQLRNAGERPPAASPDCGPRPAPWPSLGRDFIGHLLCAVGSLAIGTVLLLKAIDVFKDYLKTADIFVLVSVVTFGVPVMQILFGITLTLMIGLLGRLYSDQSREWWARLGGWIGIIAFAWTALFAATFYLPPLLHWAYDHYPKTAAGGGLLSSLLTYAGLRAGSSAETGKNQIKGHYDTIARFAPLAFSILAVAALSAFMQLLVAAPHAARAEGALRDYVVAYVASVPLVVSAPFYPEAPVLDVLKLMAVFGAAALVLGGRLDINKFSLYMMYRMRLVRAYFGAISRERRPHPFTGFDPADDPELATLLTAGECGSGGAALQRPYHIINAALNLVGGKDLAWQTRKAANFVFTPKFCGFEAPSLAPAQQYESSWRGAYRPSSDYASTSSLHDEQERIKLGAAVAISGAAASPNMGYHSSPALAFLMTLFNLRLGRWCPNPMKKELWRRATPRVALFSILAELFGQTDMHADFLYLSDGGHFENLGLYELVRRRCRLILVVDASADGNSHFEDLGNAIRRCATDFHIPIELNPRGIQRFDGGTGIGSSWVTGRVQYARADGGGRDGLLVYIKPTIVGDENADILNYSKTHPDFPHQSTADQLFDENQFESYRSLGYQTAMRAIRQMGGLERGRASWTGPLRRQRIERICTLLRIDELRARGRLRPGPAGAH